MHGLDNINLYGFSKSLGHEKKVEGRRSVYIKDNAEKNEVLFYIQAINI